MSDPRTDALLAHFRRHARDLPWRRTRDPYAIWVSEVMLQQTRVETVRPYYQRFLDAFPTVRALAEASESEVLGMWSGLGYYRRARMLHAGARAVVERHGGRVPEDPEALRALPGVGAYTAGAIASIAFGLHEPVVDGNVERVLTRLFAWEGDPRRAPLKARIWEQARAFASHPKPGDVNQALMELGATVCTPSSPDCLLCPLAKECAARALARAEDFPTGIRRAKPKPESWQALVPRDATGSWHLVRSTLGRWEGLPVPHLRPKTGTDADVTRWARSLGLGRPARTGTVVHVLTHARMEIDVWVAAIDTAEVPQDGALHVSAGAESRRGLPKVTQRILGTAATSENASTPRTRSRRG